MTFVFAVFSMLILVAAVGAAVAVNDSRPSLSIDGEHVCEVQENRTVTQKEAVDVPGVMYTDEDGRQLKTPKHFSRRTYKDVNYTKLVTVRRCCDGYYRADGEDTCEVCLHGAYGPNCAKRCNDCPTPQHICNNILGCCIPDNATCVETSPSVAMAYAETGRTVGLSVLALLGVSALLFILAFHYRRKYQKERDPPFPNVVVAYQPEKTNGELNSYADGSGALSFGSSHDSTSGEAMLLPLGVSASGRGGGGDLEGVSNPLYGDPVAARTLERVSHGVPGGKLGTGKQKSGGSPPPPYTEVAAGGAPSTSRQQNIYADLDSVIPASSGRHGDGEDGIYERVPGAVSPKPGGGGGSPNFGGNGKKASPEYDKLCASDAEEEEYEPPLNSGVTQQQPRALIHLPSSSSQENGPGAATTSNGGGRAIENPYV